MGFWCVPVQDENKSKPGRMCGDGANRLGLTNPPRQTYACLCYPRLPELELAKYHGCLVMDPQRLVA